MWELLASGYGLLDSLIEVYEGVGKSVISVCKKAQKELKMYFMAVKE